MSGGSETEDLDVELLLAARFGDLDAIATVCNHYRGRLLILARNAGSDEPEAVVQNALTASLLRVEPQVTPSLPDFERGLFDRVVSESDVLTPRAPVEPTRVASVAIGPAGAGSVPHGEAEPAGVGSDHAIVTIDEFIDTLPAVARTAAPAPAAWSVAMLEPSGRHEPTTSGVLLNPETGPVDWSALAVERTDAGPPSVRLTDRALAGGGALLCGVGVIAAIVFLLGGTGSSDESAGPAQQAELVDDGASTVAPGGGSSSGPETATGDVEQNRSSGTVTDGAAGSDSTLTVETAPTSTTVASTTLVTTASTAPPPTNPPSTVPPTTPAPTTALPTTAGPSTTGFEPTTTRFDNTTTTRFRFGDFRNQSIDNVSFRRGDFRDHDFTGAILNNVVFTGADLSGVSFAGVTMTNVRFTNSDLTGAVFRGADMDNTDFENTNVSRVDFRGSVLTNGSLDTAWFVDDPIGWPQGDFDD